MTPVPKRAAEARFRRENPLKTASVRDSTLGNFSYGKGAEDPVR